ncbi:50S ribosomal protein L11 methyltransferase [Xenorhabdus bovienii]|uniref:50S ribosomal protein L11 methyltransferase n=1 Tax=Xenorhabdus bovienii TaxID=40576 RepID=UPI0023B3530F|nr:50S ribosomal protein L11 methyltransferase [Xenorhabdus bovienii]MDE9433399.1 50S ribosomal protein L11 methyltransferase [Xenorhabdus bovienii]MDE9491252.1 50S ribosomal protein L11 methyltransferase [Xenorhabdus bovienii]MDE9507570.1 50S ribosomal protein L11 methyltransferase [Xenorhabdus bovienii]MDE9548460.1 50S ribosomal protein L11 methyltransferase [Xenorhabdus bovienii]
MLNSSVRSFDTWHYSMLNDHARTIALESAIKELNLNGKNVFEIGTGAGLISMMFAKYGAKKVLTCEINEQLSKEAISIFKLNNLDKCITLINKSSSKVIDDGDLDFTPDIIFTETIDCGVIGEGFYSISEDIKKIAQPQTIIMPYKIEQYGYLVESKEIYSLNNVTIIKGLDLSPLNRYSTKNFFPVRSHLYENKLLTPLTNIKNYDYLTEISTTETSTFSINEEGICYGMLSFFVAKFGSFCVSNKAGLQSHWHQAFHPLNTPKKVLKYKQYHGSLERDGKFTLEEF